jgi:hypothetical protein
MQKTRRFFGLGFTTRVSGLALLLVGLGGPLVSAQQTALWFESGLAEPVHSSPCS